MKCNHSIEYFVTIFVFFSMVFFWVTFLVMFLQAFDFSVMPLQVFDFSVMSLHALTFQSCQGQIVSVLIALRNHGYNYTFA